MNEQEQDMSKLLSSFPEIGEVDLKEGTIDEICSLDLVIVCTFEKDGMVHQGKLFIIPTHLFFISKTESFKVKKTRSKIILQVQIKPKRHSSSRKEKHSRIDP